MGKGRKPSTPPPSAQEMALADISLDMSSNYKGRFRPLEAQLLLESEQDRTSLVQGRGNVDTQKALAANNDVAVSRATTSGGMGSGASLESFDEGDVGSALASANQEGFQAGQADKTQRMTAAISSAQSGQDASFAGVRQAANVSNANVINKFKDDQNAKLSRAQLAETAITNGVKGYMMGKQYDANRTMIKDTQAAREAAAKEDIRKVQNSYMSGPMQLAAPARPYSLYTPPGVSLPPYQAPNQGISFVGYNPSAPTVMPLGFGVRR